MPIVVVLAGVVVRYAMSRLSGAALDLEGISGMAVKAVGWAYVVGSLQFSVGSLTGNMTLVSKVYFPREVLPLSATLAQTFDSAIGALVLFLVLPLLGLAYAPPILWALILAPLLFLFTAGLGLLLSCANLFFRDVKYIVQVLITFGIFFTPVFYEPAAFGDLGGTLMMLANPLAPILEGLPLCVVSGHDLARPLVEVSGQATVQSWHIGYLLYAAVWTLALGLGGLAMFERLEHKFAEYV